jgi:hypothetical protein
VAMRLAKETVDEAVETGLLLGMEQPVLANFHAPGFASASQLTFEKKFDMLERSWQALSEIESYTNQQCRDRGFIRNGEPQVKVVKENNFPYHSDEVFGLIDNHPHELVRGPPFGINIDFAHMQLTINYLKKRGGSIRARLEEQLYPEITWENTVQTVKNQLKLLHLNDASGYTPEKEGISIGTGEVPFEYLIPAICKNIREDIVGTVEIKNHHLEPRLFIDSVAALKQKFGEEYEQFFI